MESKNLNPMEDKKPSRKTSSNSVGLVIFRLLLTIIVAIVLGGVVYYGASGWIPFLGIKMFQPIRENESLVFEVRETQKALENQLSGISATLDASQSQIADEVSGFQATLDSLEGNLQSLTENLVSAQASVDINSQMNTYMSTVYPQKLFDLEAKQSSNSRNLEALATAQMRSTGLEEDLALIRILEQLSRSNQFLLHSNFGLAEDTLKSAKDALIRLQESSPGFQKEFTSQILDLVEGAIYDLPTKPDLALDKLELAWQLGISGLPQLDNLDISHTLTPTPYPPGFTPTPTTP